MRTTNPIESTFAIVRLQTHRTKGSGSRTRPGGQKHWHRLKRSELISNVVTGILFVDGEEKTQQAASKAESPSLLFVGFEANCHVSVLFSRGLF